MESDNLSHPRSRWSHCTLFLWFTCALYALGDIFYGYDTGMFGTLQALPSFLNTFGTKKGTAMVLPTETAAIMNGVVWLGKLFGCLQSEFVIERLGFKKVMFIVCAIQCVGVIVQLTASNWVPFSVGRVICYWSTGILENVIPQYLADISPAPVRSVFSGSLTVWLAFGQLWANLMSRAVATETKKRGWLIVTSMQIVPAVVIMLGLPLTVESPRWLISHGRDSDALVALNRLRPRQDVDSGVTKLEVEGIGEAVEQKKLLYEGRWIDIFRGTYLRRTIIASLMFFCQQGTGIQFTNVYGATFYKSIGLGSLAFTYTAITSASMMLCMAIALFFYDKIGRRPIMIPGSFLQIPFMSVVGAIGSQTKRSKAADHAVIASMILFTCAARVSSDTPSYIINAEIGGVLMRKKIMAFATCWQVFTGFAVTFGVPYADRAMGAKVAYIFAGVSAFSFLFITFFVPDTAGRALEEIDELFERRLWAWQFASAETTGIGARIAALEGAHGHHGVFDPKIIDEDVHMGTDLNEKSDVAHLEGA